MISNNIIKDKKPTEQNNTSNINKKFLKKYMEQYFLIWAVILVVGTIIFYVIMKNLLKTLATFLFIIVLFVVVTGTLTYSDINNLQTKLETMETVYIFEEEVPILGVINNEDDYQELVLDKEYEDIINQEEYYKLIIIKPEAYEGLYNPEEYIMIIKDPTNTFDERAEAFMTLNNAVKDKGIKYLWYEYKKENIKIYPKTMLFRIVSIIPASWINDVSSEE